MKKLIECVPNFSEGRDMGIIKQITDEIEKIEGVKLLDIDPGAATNRTVVTLVGTPDEVVEAAFQAVKKASELIDMTGHTGAHPRMGATDVCPFVPVSNITMEETVEYAHKLAKRIGEELNIPIYCYENAAIIEERQNLAVCRQGEYEALPKKLQEERWKPDFGPAEFNATAGATAVGARDFLVAYNINFNTTSTRRANSVAFDVREKGRVKRDGDPINGKVVLDENGNKVWEPGKLKSVKAIGWFIEEYGIAQISMNLTNINICSIHKAFDAVCESAGERGIRVTGSELVGLVPLNALLDAGKYFMKKQRRSAGVSEAELIRLAIKTLGLDELKPFKPEERIIEYVLRDKAPQLVDMNLVEFADETASESPAPGGGSISAYVGSLGASLATMVANLSSHKKAWDAKWEVYSDWAEKGQKIKDELIRLVDEDTRAFNKIMDCFGMPKGTDEEKAAKKAALEAANKYAMEVPFRVMEASMASMEVIKAMAETGNPNSVSDAGVGALCARTAVMGAYLNVKINATGVEDKAFAEDLLKRGAEVEKATQMLEEEILAIVNNKINEL
ncbi:MAG: glutamate formimidoyltransferase [Hyphomicrobiales bacterium]